MATLGSHNFPFDDILCVLGSLRFGTGLTVRSQKILSVAARKLLLDARIQISAVIIGLPYPSGALEIFRRCTSSLFREGFSLTVPFAESPEEPAVGTSYVFR
jgi:hypothetical protein